MDPPPVAPLAKKARKVWQVANPTFKQYVSGHNARATLPLKGFWLRSGAGQAELEIRGDTSGDRVAGPVLFKEAPLHGNAVFYMQSDGAGCQPSPRGSFLCHLTRDGLRCSCNRYVVCIFALICTAFVSVGAYGSF